jgi:hypothetical protein
MTPELSLKQPKLKFKRLGWLTLVTFLLSLGPLRSAPLTPETLKAWNTYVRAAKARMDVRARGECPFLWIDEKRDLAGRVRAGEVLAEPVGGYSPHPIPRGLIHDWIGAIYIPKARIEDVKAVLDDYGHYKTYFKPLVADAQVLERTPNEQKVTLLMVERAFRITAAVEAEDDVETANPAPDKLYSLTTSLRIQEIADYGKPDQHPFPQDAGPGYVWRMFTITRLEQQGDGVYEEIEMIGMSRGIPLIYRWLVQPLAEHLPQQIMVTTLQQTRDAVREETNQASLRVQRSPH